MSDRTHQLTRANARYQQRINRQSAPRAIRHSQPWTPEEIAVALDTALTARQAAEKLQRTFWGVKYIRTERWRYE